MKADWWRSWHGAPTDPKWRLIARRSEVPTHLVVAVAWALMDRASQAETRGSIGDFTEDDAEELADFLGCDASQCVTIVTQMRHRGVLDGDSFTSWSKRQPAREDSSAERTKSWRERKVRERHTASHCVTDASPSVTECHETQSDDAVTQCDAPEEIRGEERREDLPPPTSKQHSRAKVVGGGGSVPDPFSCLDPDFHERVLAAAGVDLSKDTSLKWRDSDQRWRSQRWIDDLGLTEGEAISVVREVVATNRNGGIGSLKYFDQAMQRAADRKLADPLRPVSSRSKPDTPNSVFGECPERE